MLPMRGYILIGLNVVRILSIIFMLLTFASSVFVLVQDIEAVNRFVKDATDDDFADCDYIENSTVPNQPAGVFWAVVNRLFIIFQIIVLLLSEIGWPMGFFNRYFPVLGDDFGLGPLGIFQCLIGATILSHHVDDFTLVAAFMLFSIGCLNMLLGLVFRERAKDKRSLFTWRHEKRTPPSEDARPTFVRPADGAVSNLFLNRKLSSPSKGFGPDAEKQAGLKGFLITVPPESRGPFAPPIQPSSRAGSPTSLPRFKSSDTAL